MGSSSPMRPPRGAETSHGRDFWAGVRDQLPIQLGVVPFGLIFGALAVSAGIPPLGAQALSLLVFAGSAQFAAVGLIAGGAAPFVIVLTILILNLRHLLYSATLAPYYAHLPLRWRAALAWLLTDEAFATTSVRARSGRLDTLHAYALGAGLTLWCAWQLSTALGILLGGGIPASWSLDFALPLTFLSLLTPTIVDRPTLAAACVAASLSILLRGLPFNIGLILAVLAGAGAGAALERRRPAPAPEGSASE